MNINIEKMNIKHLDTLRDILLEDFDDFWDYNILESELKSPISQYIVALSDGEIVGFAGLIDTYDQMEITNIVVKKTFRNRGIGSILLDNLISLSKEKNRIYLEVNENNINAIKLYEKKGFKKCGLRKNYYKGTENAILMELEIK